MSRIGRRAIELRSAVNISISPARAVVDGAVAHHSPAVAHGQRVDPQDGTVAVARPADRGQRRRRVGGMIGTGTAERPRLVVFRSNRGIEAQLVDDLAGRTVAAASWLQLRKSFKGNKSDQAREVGKALAAAAGKAGVERCVFD